MAAIKPSNQDIADLLNRIADLLEAQDANPFRVRAYRNGATSVREYPQPVADLVTEGHDGQLEAVPGIGSGLGAVIGEYVTAGRSDLLHDLEAEVTPATLFARVPGIGPELAARLVSTLHIQTLEELEEAAHDGRLETVAGFGRRRAEAVRSSLAGMLRRGPMRRRSGGGQAQSRPSVELLLAVDAEYRRKAEAGQLEKIAPRRFNPGNEAWLPILHTQREGWDFTALYSNTARAHELGATHDWVVIYYERDGTENQSTVVTENSGPLKGKRIVRGREPESRRYYGAQGE